MNPIFSIFTPVYNSEIFIRKCLDSVLNQTCEDFEWYIYDDGSNDASYSTCEEYAKKDSRIILSRGENGTSIDKMNQFLDDAHGEYIVFIDNDDYWDSDYLENMLKYLRKTNADCAISSYSLVDSDNKILNWYTPTLRDGEVIDQEELKKRFLTSLDIEGFRWNKIYKSNIYKHAGVRLKNIFPADIRFEFEMFDYVNSAVLVNNRGYYYRQSDGSEVGNVNLNKTIGMLDTFEYIGSIAMQEGFNDEGWYYKAWRYVNLLFLRLRDRKLSEAELKQLFEKFPWDKEVGKGIARTICLFGYYKNARDGHLKFMIKTMYVWKAWLKYREK